MIRPQKLISKIGQVVFISIAIFLVFAGTSLAAESLVPCGYPGVPACTACDFVVLLVRLVNFGILYLVNPLALLMFTYAGFVYVTSRGSEDRVRTGKKIFWNVFIGVLAIYGSYFIVDVTIRTLSGGENFLNIAKTAGPWNAPNISKYISVSVCTPEAPSKGPGGSIEESTKQATSAINSIAYSIGNILMGLAVLMVMYSAYLFLTGGGNEKQVTSARTILIFGLVGIAVALLAYALPTLVTAILGR